MKKRLFGILTAAVLAASSVPTFFVSAADQEYRKDFEDGTYVEGWNRAYIGTLDIQAAENGGFTAEWNDTVSTVVLSGKSFDKTKTLSELDGLKVSYEAELETTQLKYYGIEGWSLEPKAAFYVIEGWQGEVPFPHPGARSFLEKPEVVRTVEIDGVQYDLYMTEYIQEQITISGDVVKFPQYWSVRHENAYSGSGKQTCKGTISLGEHFRAWGSLGAELGRLPLSDAAFEIETLAQNEEKCTGSCNVSSVQFETVQKEQPAQGTVLLKTDDNHRFVEGWNDGGIGTYTCKEQDDGSLTAAWEKIESCMTLSGLRYDTAVDFPEKLQFSYETEIEADGICYYGMEGWLSNPTAEFLVVEGWNGWKPMSDETPLTTVTIDGNEYDVYLKNLQQFDSGMTAGSPLFSLWSVRKENTFKAGEKVVYKGTVSLDAHFRAWTDAVKKYNLNNSKLVQAAVSADGWGGSERNASGSCKIAKPVITISSGSQTGTFWTPRPDDSYSYDPDGDGLKDIFGPYFRMGTHESQYLIKDEARQQFVLKNFNALTCENEMKPEQIIKKIDGTNVTVDLKAADPILKFAEENKIGVRGGPFLWYSQTPDLMFSGTPEESDLRIESFIKNTFAQLAEKYPTLNLYAFDVAAEMFRNDGGGLRTMQGSPNDISKWADVYGEGNDAFIINAFKSARKYAPAKTRLYLTDYNEWMPEKTADICKLAKKIMAEGDYIDGIGLEGYIPTAQGGHPTAEEYESALKQYAALGLDIQITELYVYPAKSDYTGVNTATRQAWKDVFTLLLKYADCISGVTMRQPIKGSAWDEMPGGLFDNTKSSETGYKTLPAYDDVTALAGKVAPLSKAELTGTVNPETTTTLPETTTATAPENRTGDATCDGSVDVADAVLILRYAIADADAKITDQGVKNGDVNASGQTDSEDAALVLQYIAKKTTF